MLVQKISDGTVVDHISAGKALSVLHLLGNPQERPGMLRQRRKDSIVDATRLGAPARGFVPGGERERILNGQLHRYPPCLRGNVSRKIRAASEYHAR